MFGPAGALVLTFGLLLQNRHSTPPALPQAETLAIAVRVGNLDEVKRLLAAGADVNAPDALGSTPLLEAAWSGNSAIAGILLAHGADMNARHGEAGSTPLEYAVLNGKTAVVRLLLTAGARLDLRYRDKQTVLHEAASKENPQIVEMLLAAHAEIDAEDANGNTPLDEAVLNDRAAAVRLLIAHSADVNRVHFQDGRGPLHEACIKGFADLIQPLTAAGADPVRRDNSGQSPLDLALAYKNINAVTALLHIGAHRKESLAAAQEAMESATLRGQTEIARILVDGGFDVNQPTPAGSTYLRDAALKGQKKTVQLLLDCGARLNPPDQNGATPLHDAALGGSAEVITLLLDRGAELDAVERDTGATPLMLAASLGRTEAVSVLLRHGANPALKDRAGHTALDRARETEDTDTIKLLETALAHSRTVQPNRAGG